MIFVWPQFIPANWRIYQDCESIDLVNSPCLFGAKNHVDEE